MAAIPRKHTGTAAARLSAVLGTAKKSFIQFTLYADPDNANPAFLGPSTVTSGGANHYLKIKPGVSVTLGPDDTPFIVDTDILYVVAGGAAENLYLIVNTDERR